MRSAVTVALKIRVPYNSGTKSETIPVDGGVGVGAGSGAGSGAGAGAGAGAEGEATGRHLDYALHQTCLIFSR